ncbi:MAG: signal peptidase II [Sandaracinaceae bacterium]
MPRRTHRALAALILATLAFLALDLGSKAWVAAELSRARVGEAPPVCGELGPQRIPTAPIVLIDGYLELRYAENCGAAFGLLRSAPSWLRSTIFYPAATLAAVALTWMFVRGRGGMMFAMSVPLILSGALGNLVDRFRLGYVVDFIRFHIQNGWEWPTFNIADSTITVGVILLFLDGLRRPQEEEGETAPQPATGGGGRSRAKASRTEEPVAKP